MEEAYTLSGVKFAQWRKNSFCFSVTRLLSRSAVSDHPRKELCLSFSGFLLFRSSKNFASWNSTRQRCNNWRSGLAKNSARIDSNGWAGRIDIKDRQLGSARGIRRSTTATLARRWLCSSRYWSEWSERLLLLNPMLYLARLLNLSRAPYRNDSHCSLMFQMTDAGSTYGATDTKTSFLRTGVCLMTLQRPRSSFPCWMPPCTSALSITSYRSIGFPPR